MTSRIAHLLTLLALAVAPLATFGRPLDGMADVDAGRIVQLQAGLAF